MKRFLFLAFLILLSSISRPLVIYADCGTPIPTQTPYPSYASKVLGTQSGHLLAYWKLDETGGSTAADASGNGYNGTYSGTNLNATTFLDNNPAGSWDGVNDNVNIYSSSLATNFSASAGSILAWVQVANSGVWTDGVTGRILQFAADGNNGVSFEKNSGTNKLRINYQANSVNNYTDVTTSNTNWFQAAITWDKAADTVVIYYAGSAQSTSHSLGAWAGSLASTLSVIGATNTSGGASFHGAISHVALWNTSLSASDISNLASVLGTQPTPTPTPTCPPATDTPTPTATFTPSATLNIYSYWTLPAPESTGTAQPGQAVAFAYSLTAGQASSIVILAVILFSIWAIFIIWLLTRNRNQSS